MRTFLLLLVLLVLPAVLVAVLIIRAAGVEAEPVRVVTTPTTTPDLDLLFGIPSFTTTTRVARVVPILKARTAPSLERIKQCESGGDYKAVSRSGRYKGAYQADDQTWNGYGGYQRADEAPPEVQDQWARELQARRGNAPWPTCGAA